MPRHIKPMLATLVDKPFDDLGWLFEVKFDGYRAVAFLRDKKVEFVSRNQNSFTDDFPELASLPARVKAASAILDGEICALDALGRPSFSLMQQRTGFQPGCSRRGSRGGVPIVYYAFDILYLEGYSLMRTPLEVRKQVLAQVLKADATFRYSEHFLGEGKPLFAAAQEKGLEGVIAKRRAGAYAQKRTRDWLKIKVTLRQECVIGGYTEPRGSRENFGSLVLGLYDEAGRLIPVGQAGAGFTNKSHLEMFKRLKRLQADASPFAFKPESTRGVHFVKPELVAEIKFTEWTHSANNGPRGALRGMKMRAPVFQGLRVDKKPRDCRFELAAKVS